VAPVTEGAPADRPFPPGDYPVVVVGTGPGGLQVSYALRRLGVPHALLSQDHEAGGMFQRFPLFDRLVTWTKRHAPAPRGTRAYEWYDWNSLLLDPPDEAPSLGESMAGPTYFPSRSEMLRSLQDFAAHGHVTARYGCRWESTRRDDQGFVLATTDGEYRCRAAVFAIGMAKPWKPAIPGIDGVPHYVEAKGASHYAGRRVFIIGKRNSAFELADGLLASARQVLLVSPRPTSLSLLTHSLSGARARYLQPYEDHVLGGGTFILESAILGIERAGAGWRVRTGRTTVPGEIGFEVDDVIAATGFATPMGDLRTVGVRTMLQGRIPFQTPFFESATVPGLYFAGTASQGSPGLKKYGRTSNSAAVHGFRYNARVLARHLAETRFGVPSTRPAVPVESVVTYLLAEATRAPELWHQPSYLARVLSLDPAEGVRDEGVVPVAHFVDSSGPPAVAITIETDAAGDLHPAVYVRRAGKVEEHLMDGHALHDFETPDHRNRLASVLGSLIGVNP
jgi:thioredoxin reductase